MKIKCWLLRIFVLVIVICLSVVLAPSQTIYKWKDEKGQWHFSQTPPVGVQNIEWHAPPTQTQPVFVGSIVYAAESVRQPDVRIYLTQLQNTSSGVFFYGEVLNVGRMMAKRVRVSFRIKTEYGVAVATDMAEVDPENLRPGETGIFRKRIPYLTESSGYSWSSRAEWSE